MTDPERRRTMRVECVLPMRLYPKGAAKIVETLVKNLGVSGACVFSPSAMPPATPLSVELPLGTGEGLVSVDAEVVWSRSLSHSAQFCLGVVFHNMPEQSTVRLSRYLQRISSEDHDIPSAIFQ